MQPTRTRQVPANPLNLSALAVLAGLLASTASSQQTRVVSRDASIAGNETALHPRLSDSGRWTVFQSAEDDLVAGDTNASDDVFLYDAIAETTVRLSLSNSGAEGNGVSTDPVISADGRRVAFVSQATNFLPLDANGVFDDVFWLDLDTGVLQLASRSTAGVQGDSVSSDVQISDDGRWIAFASSSTNLVPGDTNGLRDVFLHDSVTQSTTRVSLSTLGAQPDDDCWQLDLSGDGRWVVFESAASNLVPGDTNGARDLFLRDTTTGTLTRVSVSATGAEADGGSEDPSLSADGRWLAFSSSATNLVPGDTNGVTDIFVKDLQSGQVVRASVSSAGDEGTSSSFNPQISPDGRYVVFHSAAEELSLIDVALQDSFLHDLVAGTTELLSVATDGTPANDISTLTAVSRDGRFTVFQSMATNLDPADPSGASDIYLRDRAGGPVAYCSGKVTSLGCTPAIASTGSPSASGSPFSIDASKVVGQKTGLLFYGFSGPAALPFLGGTLCVAPPLRRTAVQFSGGGAAQCNGAFAFDFDALIQSGSDPLLVAGQDVDAQYWFRDPAHSDGTGRGLSDALDFEIAP